MLKRIMEQGYLFRIDAMKEIPGLFGDGFIVRLREGGIGIDRNVTQMLARMGKGKITYRQWQRRWDRI